MKSPATAFAALALAFVGATVRADVVSYVGSFGTSIAPLPLASFPLQISLPKFDQTLGQLTNISLTLTSDGTTSLVQIFNSTGAPETFTGATATLTLSLSAPEGTALSIHSIAGPFSGIAAPGLSTVGQASTGTIFDSTTIAASHFSAFESAGAHNLTVNLVATGDYTGTTGNSGTTFFGGDGTTFGDVSVSYTFTPIPEPAIFAAVLGGTVLLAAICRARRTMAELPRMAMASVPAAPAGPR